MKLLLITKQGALSPRDAKKLKHDLKKMGYKVALAYCSSVANTYDVRVEFLPSK